jgi:hypothetical protein
MPPPPPLPIDIRAMAGSTSKVLLMVQRAENSSLNIRPPYICPMSTNDNPGFIQITPILNAIWSET